MFHNIKKSFLFKYPVTEFTENDCFAEIVPDSYKIKIDEIELEYDIQDLDNIWKEINESLVLKYDEYIVFDKCGLYINYAPPNKIEVRMIVCGITNYSNLYWFDAFLCKSQSSNSHRPMVMNAWSRENSQPGFKCRKRICCDVSLSDVLTDVLNQTIDINTHVIRVKNISHYECVLHKRQISKHMQKIFNSIMTILDINKKYV